MAKKKSDLSRAFHEDGALKTHVGGQALIEGVMMRGKFNWACAVREPDGGIYTEEHDLASGKEKNKWMSWPIVRGCCAFVESLVLGFKALEVAAMHAYGDEEEGGEGDATGRDVSEQTADFDWKRDFGRPETMIDGLGAQRELEIVPSQADGAVPEERGAARSECSERSEASDDVEGDFGHREMVISMVLGIVLGVVLFIVVPAAITNFIVGEYDDHTLAWNIVDGLLRVAVFVFYIWLIGRMEDIKRMFMYHGAEHKTIHCYEHGLPLTPENARDFPRLHVRCGTAFLIMVMIIAILVYTIFPLNAIIGGLGVPDGAPKLLLVIALRIILLPFIAGISYEITVKWAGSHPDNPLVKVILWPGMQMQYLTTNEPDDEQLECAIAAMKIVLEREKAEAQGK